MINRIGRSAKACATFVILGLCALGASAEEPTPYDWPAKTFAAAVQTPETAIQGWPERPRSTARALIEKYGEPSSFDAGKLVWDKNGPWQKTVVYRKAPQGFLHSKDIVEQSIVYDVPDNKLPEIKSFDSRLKFDRTSGQLSARSESESLNYLALNLADEIVTDKRNADEARDFYRKTMKLSESGKGSAYLDGFVFPLVKGKASARNPDEEPAPIEEPYRSGMPERNSEIPRPGNIPPPLP